MPPALSSSARARALAFVVPGKSPKQLEEWCKAYAPEQAERLKGTTERYPWMVAVQDRMAEIKKKHAQEQGEHAEEHGEEEDEEAKTRAAKRKSRGSFGYESGDKPATPSPRVAKLAGGKRKSATFARTRAEEEAQEAEEEAASGLSRGSSAAEEESAASASPRPSKKSRTTKSVAKAPAAAAPSSRRVSKAGGAAAKKGRRGTRQHEEEPEEEEELESRASSEEMHDVRTAPVKPVTAKPAAGARGRASMGAKPSAASAAFVDSSLFASSAPAPKLKAKTSVEIEDEEEHEEAEEDTDVHMRSPSPSPPARLSTAPNPFQAAPRASPQPAFTSGASGVPAARASFGARASSGGASPSFGVASPFTQAQQPSTRKPSPFAGSTSDESNLRPSFGEAVQQPFKYTPSLASRSSAPYSFSPTGGFQSASDFGGFGGFGREAQPRAGVHEGPVSPLEQRVQHDAEDYSYLPPSFAPSRPSMGRASFGSTAAQREAQAREERELEEAEGGAAPRETQPYRRSTSHWQQEQKYAPVPEVERFPAEEEEEEQEEAVTPSEDEAQAQEQFQRAARRSTDQAASETGVSPVAVRVPFSQRARRFCSSLGHFLLRTLLIGLMVLTVGTLLLDNSLSRILFGERASSTVFWPSGMVPGQQTPELLPLPADQATYVKCPPHGYCTPEGRLECDELFVREGDACVANDEFHKRSKFIKDAMIDVLEQRAGDVECGVVPRGTAKAMSESELCLETSDGAPPLPSVQQKALELLRQEAAPMAGRGITTSRVLRTADGRFEAREPLLNFKCKLSMLFHQFLPHIVGASLILSLITYLVFQFRLWRWRRAQVPLVSHAVRERLRSLVEYTSGSARSVPLAVPHLRQEYISGELTGAKGDGAVWARVERELAKDSRVEPAVLESGPGRVKRKSWTWTGPL